MKPLLASLCALAALATSSFRAAIIEGDDAPVVARTVILVRHAEKESAPKDPRDPGLSEAGQERAENLARLLGASGAQFVFTSDLERTRATVAPLAAKLGVTSAALPAAQSETLVARLDALAPGSVAVVCGHSNTVPRVAELLGVKLAGLVVDRGMPMLADDSYDRVFVITRPASGPAACVELNYGATSSKTVSAGK